jgi:AhpD family alkylhydroperoxidase
MKERMQINNAEPAIYQAMEVSDKKIESFELDPKLRELVKVRVSQINGCGYCINAHTIDALKLGETAQRLFGLSAWWETPYFTEEERAVLRFAEQVTLISAGGVSDAVYQAALQLLGEKKLAQLIFVVLVINSWNRIAISIHMVAES